ncbi:MAG: glutathione S-transferase family protein [Pseudomonadota bacterium]|nr:glutathione S-transferase family protein [Pseudomonadota bacterium]
MITGLVIFLVLLTSLGLFRHRYGAKQVVAGVRHGERVPHDAEFELYANGFSHCSRKTMLALAERDITFTYRHVDLIETGRYGTLDKDYLRVNPNGLIPALVHKGVPIIDSDEIVNYITTQLGSHSEGVTSLEIPERHRFWIEKCRLDSLDPMGGIDTHIGACIPGLTLPLFAVMMQSVSFSALLRGLALHNDRKRVMFFVMARLLGPARVVTVTPIRTLIETSKSAVVKHLQELEQHLAESAGPYLIGSEFGIGDAALSVVYLRLEEAGWLDILCPHSEFPLIRKHYDTLRTRRSWEVLEDAYPARVAQASGQLRELIDNKNSRMTDLYRP